MLEDSLECQRCGCGLALEEVGSQIYCNACRAFYEGEEWFADTDPGWCECVNPEWEWSDERDTWICKRCDGESIAYAVGFDADDS